MNGPATQLKHWSHRGRRLAVRAIATATIGTTALVVTGATSAPAAQAPTPLPAPQIAQRVEPAVELIETDVSGSVRYYGMNLDMNALIDWGNNDPGAQSAASPQDFSRALLQELATNPGTYLSTGQSTTVHDEFAESGSGYNITPDGYIVTNAHVVTMSTKAEADGLFSDTVKPVASALMQSVVQQFGTATWYSTALSIPDDQVPLVANLVAAFIQQTKQVGDISTTVYAGGGPLLSRNLARQGQVARVVTAGDPFPGKDVAILKIEATNLPTIPLGDDTAVQTGDTVYAIGYPGDATFSPAVSDAVTAQPTLSTGTVSNRLQSSAANYQYIENTATINHGNSGGPLLDDKGHVVGITTALDASTEQANGVNGGKFNYAVPTSVVRDFLTANHVLAASSPDQALFNEALGWMPQHHYSAALKNLREAKSDGFNSPYLQTALQTAQANQKCCDVPIIPPSRLSSMVPVAAGAGAAIVIAAFVIAIVRRRRTSFPGVQPPFPSTRVEPAWTDDPGYQPEREMSEWQQAGTPASVGTSWPPSGHNDGSQADDALVAAGITVCEQAHVASAPAQAQPTAMWGRARASAPDGADETSHLSFR